MRELTDSYCERCGTRYTFGSSPAKGPSLTGARLFAKGLKNFVMTDGTSMDEAMAAARIDVTKNETSRVTEEFHRTFNFCMTCRQYACDKCWNENQGACLSCAPLWDQQPAASQGHQIAPIPAFREEHLVGAGEAPAVLHAAPATANSLGVVAWPEQDELPGRTAGRADVGKPGTEPAPRLSILRASQTPAQRPRPAQVPQPAQVPTPEKSPEEPRQVEPTRSPEPLAPPPATPQPQSRPNQERQPARVFEEERSAAEQLHSQSQAWRSSDDGWTLWPPGVEPAAGELTLTPEEIKLVEAQLNRAPVNDDSGAPPTPPVPSAAPAVAAAPVSAAAPPPEATPAVAAEPAAAATPIPPAPTESGFVASHTLLEDAARITEPQASVLTEPANPIPAAWEPETPAPQRAPLSDFDLLGSLREPIELPQPIVGREPRRGTVLDRLLGRRSEASETPPEPQQPGTKEATVKPAAHEGSAPTTPWPVATPWVERPIERHDWWSDADAAEQGPPGEVNAERVPAAIQQPTAAEAGPAGSQLDTTAPVELAGRVKMAPAGEPAPVLEPVQAAETAPAAIGPVGATEPAPAAIEPIRASEPELELEPIQAAEPVAAPDALPTAEPEPPSAPAGPSQQPLFNLPVSTDRWPVAGPDLPRLPVADGQVTGPLEAAEKSAPQPKPAQLEPVKAQPDSATPWPPIGAIWPAPARPEAPWPLPDNDPLSASVVAAAAAERGDRPESPLVAALWAESAQQVLDKGSVRVCLHCALPVSTQARFCRRCGTPQG